MTCCFHMCFVFFRQVTRLIQSRSTVRWPGPLPFIGRNGVAMGSLFSHTDPIICWDGLILFNIQGDDFTYLCLFGIDDIFLSEGWAAQVCIMIGMLKCQQPPSFGGSGVRIQCNVAILVGLCSPDQNLRIWCTSWFYLMTGWWFQTCFMFHNIWDNHG